MEENALACFRESIRGIVPVLHPDRACRPAIGRRETGIDPGCVITAIVMALEFIAISVSSHVSSLASHGFGRQPTGSYDWHILCGEGNGSSPKICGLFLHKEAKPLLRLLWLCNYGLLISALLPALHSNQRLNALKNRLLAAGKT